MKVQGRTWKRNAIKAVVMVLGAAMTMGNQKCEQQGTSSERKLKKIVELGAIKSSVIKFPDGSYFDFQFVANQQMYSVLLGSNDFTFKESAVISNSPINEQSSDGSLMNLSRSDKQMMKASSQAGKGNGGIQNSQAAWCMVNLPQAKIKGSINSFELVGGGDLTIGFNSAGHHPTSGIAGLGFEVSSSQLSMSMRAIQPLSDKVLAAGNVTSSQTKTSVNFQLIFGAFAVGPSAFYQTPLAKVTENALKKAVANLSENLGKEEWYTRVLADHDTHLVVIGGTDVGLEVGDELLIYNEEYYWEGEPCNSKYTGGFANAGDAVAKIRIDSVGDAISRGLVIDQNDFRPEIGAKVKLFKMHDPDYQADQPGVNGGTQAVDSNQGTKAGRG